MIRERSSGYRVTARGDHAPGHPEQMRATIDTRGELREESLSPEVATSCSMRSALEAVRVSAAPDRCV
jgi:hypothetical protein